MITFASSIRDPIHGTIPLTAYERDLLRTRPYARLRGVRQMGMAYTVYAGAHHTRYEHVIGAMHTAWVLCQDLDTITEAEKRLVRLAAMSHDLGHRPFSHSLEDAARRFADRPGLTFLQQFLDHEEWTRELLLQDPEIGAVLARHPETAGIDREELAALATGEHPIHKLNLLIHSEIDADRIDYVLRDNYYCGFAHGVDTQTLSTLYVPDEQYGLVLNADRAYVATQLLSARYHLISNIQNNAIVRLGDLLLASCIETALCDAENWVKEAFVQAVNVGQDSDLEQFLRQHGGAAWDQLQTMVGGELPYAEMVLYDFPLLSPFARYALQSLQQQGRSVGQPLQEAIATKIPGGLLIDLRRISPPVDPLRTSRVARTPWHGRLTEFPTVRGIVIASLEALGVRVFAPIAGIPDVSDGTFQRLVEDYRTLDSSLDLGKAEGMLQGLWEGDRRAFGLLLALEATAFEQAKAKVAIKATRIDRLFLCTYAALLFLEAALNEPRVYLDGQEAIVELLGHERMQAIFGAPWTDLPRGDAIGPWQNDLLFLEHCGLMTAPVRVERVRTVFVPRTKYGSTGWGRRLFHLLTDGNTALLEALQGAVTDVLGTHLDTYRGYFGLLGGATEVEGARRRELRRTMPVPFTR
ncbi:MAG: HD domain-containing protein [Candidatus Sericytochromatia bacterium]|nr:HD domain-containing protein [Candidatus Sericytochromatia bacterium]